MLWNWLTCLRVHFKYCLAHLIFYLHFGILLFKLIPCLGDQDLPMIADLLHSRPDNCVKVIEPLVTIVLDALHLDLVQKGFLEVGIDLFIVKELVLNFIESLLHDVIHLVHLSGVHDLGDVEVLLDQEVLVELDRVLF